MSWKRKVFWGWFVLSLAWVSGSMWAAIEELNHPSMQQWDTMILWAIGPPFAAFIVGTGLEDFAE